MSADPKEDCQLQDLQCDYSSSTSLSSGYESPQHGTAPKETFFPSTLFELNLNDEQTTSSALALPTSSSSSDLDVGNEENLQVAQSPGSQDQTSSQVQITGGEFVGAHFGPQTTNQNFNLEKLEHSQQLHIHHHYHSVGSSEQGSSSEEPVGATGYTPDQHQAVTEEPSTSSEEVPLSPSIKLFPKVRISDNVFRGEQTSKLTGTRKLAIKFLQYRKEKLREANILTKLCSHQNVVSIAHSDIYNLGVVEHIYIAMELCHRQNLQDYVNENKNNNVPFDPQLSISQAKQLIEGMKHIHSNDIIHRDLKPHNILFSLDKKTLKIADFGISKEMISGRTVIDVTNARAGTDGYRAPETYNSNVISKQTDIFSLGLVFYFLWSNGHHSFGKDPDEWNINIKRNRDPDFSHLLLPDKEKAIDLLEWMLCFNPRERPTVCQILKHQMFGGTEKGPAPTISGTTPTGSRPSSTGTVTAPIGSRASSTWPRTRPKEAKMKNKGFFSSTSRRVTRIFMSTKRKETPLRSKQGTAPTSSGTAPTSSGTTTGSGASSTQLGTRPKGFFSSTFRKVSRLFMSTERKEALRSKQGPARTSSGTAPTGSGTAPTGSGTTPTRLGTAPTGSGTTPTRLGTAPTGSGTAPTGSGTAPIGSGTAPTGSGIAPTESTASSSSGTRPKAVSSTQESHHHMNNEEYSLASESLQNLLEYQTFENMSAEYIEQVADDHFKHSRLVPAYITYICSSKRYKTHSSPSDAVKAIERCIKRIREVVEKEKQVGSRSILLNYVQSDIKEMFENQASCYLDLGVGNNNLMEYERARDYLLQGLKVMKNHFKDDVVKHKLYGHILKNLVVAEYKLGNRREALDISYQAIDAFEKAEDYKEEVERSNDIHNAVQGYLSLSVF